MSARLSNLVSYNNSNHCQPHRLFCTSAGIIRLNGKRPVCAGIIRVTGIMLRHPSGGGYPTPVLFVGREISVWLLYGSADGEPTLYKTRKG